MKRMLTAVLSSTILAVSLSAQSSQTAQSQEAKSQEGKSKQPLVTVTGCLRNGEEPSTFVLTSVKWLNKATSDAKAGEATGTSGTDVPTSGATLRLVGSPSGVRLSEHVGRMVEVTGTIIDEAEAAARQSRVTPEQNPQATPPAREQDPPRPSPSAAQPKAEHTLNVRTVRMIGENCTPDR
jgi:hypothetical protein